MAIKLSGQRVLGSRGVTLANDTELASFTDSDLSDTASSFTATIDWGDGTTTSGTIVGSNGSFTVEGGHTYLDEGSPQLVINVTRTTDSMQLMLTGTVGVGAAPAPGTTETVPAATRLGAGAVSGAAGGAADPNAGMAWVVQVDDNSDKAINADVARATFGVDGTGLKIGILSDSFNVLGDYATDIANGNLPNNVTVLAEGPAATGTDEGRSMCELVYKDAPGAHLYFATATGGQTTFANNIAALQAAGCNIILDDFTYFAEPFYQMGDAIDTAIANFVAAGGTYVTAAANNANAFYESAFKPISFNLPGVGLKTVHDFGGGNPYEQVTLANDTGATNFNLQWSQPFKTIGGGAGSNDSLGFYVFDQNHNFLFSVNGNQVGSDPVQSMFMNDLNGAVRYIAIADDAGPVPSQFKFVMFANGNGSVLDGPGNGVGSGAITGHNQDPNAITVAAVDYHKTPNFGTNPPVVEDFSDFGPGELLFDQNGNPLPSPVFLNKPDVAGPDGSATDPLNPFFGTSAATPNIGAVAALVMQENPALTPHDIKDLLEDSAVAMADPSQSGAGLVQADKAVQFASNDTITAFTGGNTRLLGTHLNDTFVGDGRVITVAFTGPRAAYSIVYNADGSVTITDNRPGSPDGTDKLIAVDVARFADETFAFNAKNDFNADGASDLLLQNNTGITGINTAPRDVMLDLLRGTTVSSSATISTPAGWNVEAAADFNHDGKADIIVQTADGTPQIWLMNGTSVTSTVALPNSGTSWHVIATGDFNADGNADILWQNNDGLPVIWFMNGTSLIGGAVLPNSGPSWHVIGTGDFNADGKSDIIWQNTDGQPFIWEMNGANIIGAGALPNSGPSWHVIGTGDFNGDGKADLLWQATDGQPVIWELNGTSIIGAAVLPNSGPTWHAIGTSDFNGDGKSDIIWQNDDGLPFIWEMNGTTMIGAFGLPNPGPTWHIQDDGPISSDPAEAGAQSAALHLSSPDVAAADPQEPALHLSSPDAANPVPMRSAPDLPVRFDRNEVANPFFPDGLPSGLPPQGVDPGSRLATFNDTAWMRQLHAGTT